MSGLAKKRIKPMNKTDEVMLVVAEYDEMKRQRDELLAALKNASITARYFAHETTNEDTRGILVHIKTPIDAVIAATERNQTK